MAEKSKTKRIILIIAVVLLIMLIVCSFLSRAIYTARLPNVVAAQAGRDILRFVAQVDAEIEHTNMITLTADREYTIAEVYIRWGNRFNEGDPLLRIDLEAYQQAQQQRELEELRLRVQILEIDEEIETVGGSEELRLRRDLYVLELELLIEQGADSIVDEYGVLHAPDSGQVAAVNVEEGQRVSAGDALLSFGAILSDTYIVWYLDEIEALPFVQDMTATFTYYSGTLRTENVIVSQDITRQWEPGAGRFRYSMPYDTISRNLHGMHGELELVHEYRPRGLTVPASAVLAPNSDNPALLVLAVRDGLFGQEKYARLLDVDVIDMSPDLVAVESLLLNEGDWVISEWSGILLNGDAVWAENLGVRAFE